MVSQFNKLSKSIRFQWPRLNYIAYFQDHPISYHHISLPCCSSSYFLAFFSLSLALALVIIIYIIIILKTIFNIFLFFVKNSIHIIILNVSSCQINCIIFSFFSFLLSNDMNHIFGFTIDASHIGCLPASIYLAVHLFLFGFSVSGNCYRKSFAMQPDFSELKQNKHHHIVLFCCCCCFFMFCLRRQQTYFPLYASFSVKICSVFTNMRTGADKFFEFCWTTLSLSLSLTRLVWMFISP